MRNDGQCHTFDGSSFWSIWGGGGGEGRERERVNIFGLIYIQLVRNTHKKEKEHLSSTKAMLFCYNASHSLRHNQRDEGMIGN